MIGALPIDAAREAIEKPLLSENVSITPESMNRIFEATQGYPIFCRSGEVIPGSPHTSRR